jgi:hypothetical protein
LQDAAAQVGARRFDSDAVEAKYKEFCLSHPNAEMRRLLKGRDQSVAQTIVDFAATAGAGVVIVGADGMSAFASGKRAKLGSVSDAVVRTSTSTVVCMQPRQGTFTSPVHHA